MSENVPDSSVRRLSAYLRQLEHLSATGVKSVSSRQLAERLEVGAAQVRRDLALFGQFGHPGIGYGVTELIDRLRRILGTHKRWKVVVVGAGELSHALLRYPGFPSRGFDLVAAFDTDPKKVGTKIGGVSIRHVDELSSFVAESGVRLAILAVPADAAQAAAELLADAGITGILNFATASLEAPPGVHISQVDITAHLEKLSFQVTRYGSREKRHAD